MKEALIIFTRVPIKGKTKTRLEGFLSQEECKDIHISFLKDIKREFEDFNKDIFIFYTPEGNEGILTDIFKDIGEYHVQEGENLGEKMLNSIKYVLENGYDSCVLIGTDVPEVKKEYIEDAFNLLRKKDVVLGPTEDMGYYLIGMKKPHEEIFTNQKYGSGDVLSNTLKKVKRCNLTYSLVKTCLDIDDKSDFLVLEERIKSGKVNNCTYTIKFIESLRREKLGENKRAKSVHK